MRPHKVTGNEVSIKAANTRHLVTETLNNPVEGSHEQETPGPDSLQSQGRAKPSIGKVGLGRVELPTSRLSVLPPGRRLIHAADHDAHTGDGRADDGGLAARSSSCASAAFGTSSQYRCDPFRRLPTVTCSMSRAGNVGDNAAMESFLSTVKPERTSRRTYRTQPAALADVFD